MRKSRVRLKDIAEAAEVSVMSVSHVLNGSGAGRISVGEERSRHIRETAKKLSYVPSYAARALRGSSLRVIGSICHGVMDPVRARALACLQWEAAQHDYHLMSTSLEDKTQPWNLSVMAMLSHGVGALVVICDSLKEIQQAKELGEREGVMVIPLRLDGGRLKPETGGVQIDTASGIELALDALGTSGAQNIKIYHTGKERAWAKTARKFRCRKTSIQEVQDCPEIKDLLANGDGVLCSNDLLAARIIRGADEIVAGKDFSIIGWGNAAACEYLTPRLSSVGLDLPTVMSLAMRSIMEKSKTEIMWVRPILLDRETCQSSHR